MLHTHLLQLREKLTERHGGSAGVDHMPLQLGVLRAALGTGS